MTEKNSVDITKLSDDDLKKLKWDDVRVYINEIPDPKEVSVFLVRYNTLKNQLTDKSNSNHNLINFRKKFRETDDLELRLDEIYNFINENKLLLDEETNAFRNEIELRLEQLTYKNLNDIKKLEKVPCETAKRAYKKINDDVRDLFSKICGLYTTTMSELDDQMRAKDDLMELLVKLAHTPQVGSSVDTGNIYEQAFKTLGKRAGLIDREKIAKRNDDKAKELYKEAEKQNKR